MNRTFKVVALTAVCLLIGIIIAWQFRSVKENEVLAQYEKKSVSEIVDELLMEKNNNEKLKTRIQELQQEVDAFKNDENVDKKYVEELKKEVERARIMAGLATVKGPGLIITVAPAGERTIEDKNIEELINELKASDVQAISVNDERIVATSEIRKAGDYIMINGNQLVPPYTIKAIGDAEKMEGALSLLGGVLEKFEFYNFKVDLKEENVIIPGVRDDGTVLRINMMTPVEQ